MTQQTPVSNVTKNKPAIMLKNRNEQIGELGHGTHQSTLRNCKTSDHFKIPIMMYSLLVNSMRLGLRLVVRLVVRFGLRLAVRFGLRLVVRLGLRLVVRYF